MHPFQELLDAQQVQWMGDKCLQDDSSAHESQQTSSGHVSVSSIFAQQRITM